MKKLLFLLLIIPNFAFSQDLLSKFMALKGELNYIDSIGQNITSISISSSGDWIILYGDFGYSYSNLPKSALAYLNKLNSDQSKIKDFDFLASDTAWLCISKHNAYAFKYASKDLADDLKQLNAKQVPIYQFTYLANQWAVVYEKGKIAYHNIPQDAIDAIKNLQSQNRIIRYIALYPNNGWLLLYGKNEYTDKNIPQDCENQLSYLKTNNHEINNVVFFNQAWIIIYDSHKFSCNF